MPVAEEEVGTPYYSENTLCWCVEKPIYDVIIGNIPGAVGLEIACEAVQGVQTRSQVIKEAEHGRYKSLKVLK